MTAKRGTHRTLSRFTPPVLGLLAIAISVVSMTRAGWSVERVAHDWWALASIGGMTLGVVALLCAFYNYGRGIPRGSRRALAIAVTFGVTVPLVVVGVIARAVTHDDADLGSLPAWISAGGALFTAGGVLLALHSYRSTQRADLEDQANQVRLLRLAVLPTVYQGGKLRWTTEFANKSDGPLYSITIHGFRASPKDGKPAVPMRAIEKVFLEDDPRGRDPLILSGMSSHPELAAGEKFRTLWQADERADTSSAPRHFTVIWFSVTDANGRTWNVADNYAPTKVPRPDRPLL